jgi:hypothetical protein
VIWTELEAGRGGWPPALCALRVVALLLVGVRSLTLEFSCWRLCVVKLGAQALCFAVSVDLWPHIDWKEEFRSLSEVWQSISEGVWSL